jgi:hypothetical protein
MYNLTPNEINNLIDKCYIIFHNKYFSIDEDELKSFAGETITNCLITYDNSIPFDNYVFCCLNNNIIFYLKKLGLIKYNHHGKMIYNRRRNDGFSHIKYLSSIFKDEDNEEDFKDKHMEIYNFEQKDLFNNIIIYLKSLDIKKFGKNKRRYNRRNICIKILVLYFWQKKTILDISRELKIDDQICYRMKDKLLELLREYYEQHNNKGI